MSDRIGRLLPSSKRARLGLAAGVAIIIAAAVAGKWLGASLAARAMGLPAREANALGILMNTRGLVELVVLNIGYETGLLSQRVFSMLVAMAILTTLMTTPLLRWTYLRGDHSNGPI